MKRGSSPFAGFVLLVLLAAQVHASDHADGPATSKHHVVDLTDLYAFPTMQKPGLLSLLQNDLETDLHDQYNAAPNFSIPADHAANYRERTAKNLLRFDRAGDHTDWTDADRLALAEILMDDFLVVDTSRPCDEPAYFEIGRSLLTHTTDQTCGGRKLAEDVMDVLFGLCAGGLNGKLIRDGVDPASRPLSDQFPYLAPPDTAPSGNAKTAVINPSIPTSGSEREY